MKRARTLTLVGIALLALLAIALPVIAQEGQAILEPLVINVEQQVPAQAELQVPDGNGGTISTTIPLTLDVALQVKIQGDDVSLTGPGEMPEPTVSVAEGPIETTDMAGVKVTIRNQARVNVLQINSSEVLDNFYIEGIVLNGSERTVSATELAATLYDDAGEVLGYQTGSLGFTGMSFDKIPPGSMAPFRITPGLSGGVDASLVDHYMVEVKPNFE